MKLISLTLEGYRQFRERVEIPFPEGLMGVCGPNGAGKTKLIEAIGFALFGPRPGILPKGDKQEDLTSRAAEPGTRARVEVIFQVRDDRYRVVRTINAATLYVGDSREAQATGPGQVTSYVQRVLRLTPATFQGTFVARQRDVAGFQALDPAVRKRRMNQLIGIAQVERALALAKAEVDQRATAARQAQAEVTLSVEQARDAVEAITADHEQAARDVREWTNGLEAARAARQQADGAAAALRVQIDRISARRDHLSLLVAQRDRLNVQKAAIDGQFAKLAEDEAAKAKAEQLLVSTQRAVDDLAGFNQLARIEQLGAEIRKLQVTLDGPLADRERARAAIQIDIAGLDQQVDQLRQDADRRRDAKAQAEVRVDQLGEQIRQLDDQLTTATGLGADGICPTCGGMLGERLDTVLQRLQDEKARLRASLASSQSSLSDAANELTRLTHDETRVTRERAGLRQRLERDFATVQGEIAATSRQHAQLEDDLERERASLPTRWHGAVYDAAIHRETAARAAQHAEAREQVAGFSYLAERRRELDDELTTVVNDLSTFSADIQQIEENLAAIVVDPDALARADREAAEAKTAEEAAHASWMEAREKAAGITPQLERARGDLERASAAQRRADAAIRRQRLAETVHDTLHLVLDSLTGEARPQLEQLMAGWMLALLGPRFRTIELTDDYGIRADNGSGPHDIAHFSGGEQTILAIMLRAAVSLFCRERAGFDTGFLVLDEVFGDQDAQRRNLLVQFLEEIKDQYHQIIVVNHLDEVSGQLDSVLQVSPIGENESRVEILQ